MLEMIVDQWIKDTLKAIAVCIMAVLIVIVLMLAMADESMTPKYTLLSQDGTTAVYMVVEND